MDNGINKNEIRVHYDAEQNIFYLLFTEKAQKALAEETDDEVFVRFDQDTRKVISVEFLNFQKRITNVFGCSSANPLIMICCYLNLLERTRNYSQRMLFLRKWAIHPVGTALLRIKLGHMKGFSFSKY